MDNELDLRVSNQDRDAVVQKLQGAFLEGRLTDAELSERVDLALAAKVRGDLKPLLADLPAVTAPPPSSGPTPRPLRSLQTRKSHAVQQGRWTVARRFSSKTYKSTQVLDLTRAVLQADRTELRISAYKSEVTVIVPPGVRVELRGSGYQSTWTDETLGEGDGPVVVVKGSGYKSRVVVKRG